MNKTEILANVSPQEIYTKFLNLSEFPTSNVHSPFSADKNASLRVYKNGTFKCFSSGKQGDCFQFVADIKKLDCKKDFNEVTRLIAKEFNLIITNEIPKEKLKVTSQNFTSDGLNFWKHLHVSPELLKNYKVSQLKSFEYWETKNEKMKKIPIYTGVLAYSYETNGRYEVYLPKQPEKKVKKFFYSGLENSDIFGLEQIEDKQNFIVICAGKKDCLILNSYGISAVTFRSESIFPTQSDIAKIAEKCDKIYICYDNDFDKQVNSGRVQMLKISEKYNITPILLPNQINDIENYFEFFPDYPEESFRKLINDAKQIQIDKKEAEEQPKQTIFHIAERYLSAYYDFRFNRVKLDLEISPKNQNNFVSLNENSLYIELQKRGINISMEKLLSILKSEFVPKFDPISTYFEQLPPYNPKREKDYISELCGFVSAYNQDDFNLHLRKWLVRTVKCATITEYFNKQAFILVHDQQNSGKSTFCRFLCPPSLSDYIAEDISNDKDARILLCKNFIINLDELAVLSKQEINSLKSYFSKTQINERLPYDRKNSILNRTCSFIGSTNMDEFLNDETGSVRWLCFRINSINWAYSSNVDINRVWAQSYYLSKNKDFECELTYKDITENEERNKDFQILSKEKALVYKFFGKPENENQAEFMTSTDVCLWLQAHTPENRLSNVAIGKAMKGLGFKRIKDGAVYGYYVVVKKENL